MYRVYVYAVSAAVVAAVIWPAFRHPVRDDSFPLSTYPMFSSERPRTMAITHVLGVDADGERKPLPPPITSDNPEVLQSMMTIRRAVHAPRRARARYCRRVAERVAESDDEDLKNVERLELATSVYDAVAYFEQRPEPLRRRVHHRCRVQR